jgi:hypothetical protein
MMVDEWRPYEFILSIQVSSVKPARVFLMQRHIYSKEKDEFYFVTTAKSLCRAKLNLHLLGQEDAVEHFRLHTLRHKILDYRQINPESILCLTENRLAFISTRYAG